MPFQSTIRAPAWPGHPVLAVAGPVALAARVVPASPDLPRRASGRAGPVAPVVQVAPPRLTARGHPRLPDVADVADVADGVAVAVAALVHRAALAAAGRQQVAAAVRICCWCHGSRVARRRAPGWRTVAG